MGDRRRLLGRGTEYPHAVEVPFAYGNPLAVRRIVKAPDMGLVFARDRDRLEMTHSLPVIPFEAAEVRLPIAGNVPRKPLAQLVHSNVLVLHAGEIHIRHI